MKRRLIRVGFYASLILVLSLVVAACSSASISVSDAWLRSAPAGEMTAGYFQIHNGTKSDVRIVSASSSQLGEIEIHETRAVEPDSAAEQEGNDHGDENDHGDDHGDDHVMMMMQVDGVDVPAGKTVEFAPGGLHLMMLSLPTELELGDEITLDLHFADGATLSLNAEVR